MLRLALAILVVGVVAIGAALTPFVWVSIALLGAGTIAIALGEIDRRGVAKALAESRQRFQDIAEVSGDWVWETDAAHCFVLFEGGGLDGLSLLPDAFLGRTRWDVAGADVAGDPAWATHKADLDAHRPFRAFRYPVGPAGAPSMFISVSGKPRFDGASHFLGYRGTATDETDIVEARRRAERAEALLHDAIESMSEGFVIYDDEDRMVMCNAAYRRFYPENAGRDLVGVRFADMLREGIAVGRFPEARGNEEAWIAERVRRHRDVSNTIEQQVADGRWVLVTKHLMSNGWIAGLRVDITALKAAQAALSEIEARLRQAQKMEAIGNLTGGLAHDFNNLLGVIIGNLDLVRSLVAADDETAEFVKDATDAALSGAELTRRLLAFARRQPLQPERIAPNELVNGIVRLLRRTLGEQIEITLDLADDLWPIVVDPAQLEASLTNLATNARDAMPNGGRLTITTARRRLDAEYAASHVDVTAGDYVAIEVTDGGTGMPPEIVERIFEPFYTTKEPGKGTGLGLSMVFGFLKQSGGHVAVYSEVGRGTTFRLYLPRAEGDAPEAGEQPVSMNAQGAGERVLAVEDNPGLRRIVMRQLRQLGYRPIEADGAATALDILESQPIDLLFTDVVMPGPIDGIALARQAIDRWPKIKVVLTSGFPGTQLDDQLAPAGTSVRLLSKPYRAQDLAVVLREALSV